jgi:hypothetical protein
MSLASIVLIYLAATSSVSSRRLQGLRGVLTGTIRATLPVLDELPTFQGHFECDTGLKHRRNSRKPTT